MFWAGDTAQTISVGSAFRFNDLKAFLYRVEEVSSLLPQEIQSQIPLIPILPGKCRQLHGEANPTGVLSSRNQLQVTRWHRRLCSLCHRANHTVLASRY